MLLRLKLYRILLKLTAYLLPFPAFELGWRIWAASSELIGRPVAYSARGHFAVVLFGSCLWAFMAEHYRVTNVDELFRERTGAKAAASATAATAVVLLGILYFGRSGEFPRGLFICLLLALLTLTVALHAIFRFLCRKKLKLGRPVRILVVGADQFAQAAACRLQRLSFAPCKVVAYVRLPGQEVADLDARIYNLEHFGSLHAGDGIDEAVMAIHPAHFSTIPQIIKELENLSVPARAIVDLGEGIVVRERLFQVGRMQMLDLTTTPADLLDYALIKRVFDVCFSLLVLLLTSPLLPVIAALIRLASPGPILFAQQRVGLNGLTFQMYKFRTMRVGPSSESDTRWTSESDPRRTRIGTFFARPASTNCLNSLMV